MEFLQKGGFSGYKNATDSGRIFYIALGDMHQMAITEDAISIL